MKATITTQRELRRVFWESLRNSGCVTRRRPGGHNAQTIAARVMFCDFVDALQKNGDITESLASRATLGDR